MDPVVLDLSEVDRSSVALVGGKAANLGELTRLPGLQVPSGLCLTTAAYRRFLEENPQIPEQIGRLGQPGLPDQRAAAAALRQAFAEASIPAAIVETLRARLPGPEVACAVRSSATSEDLPFASFAGQHHTALNVAGVAAVLAAVRACWASLWSDQAIVHRAEQGVDPSDAHMGVLIQRLVFPEVSGVMFTADPLSGNRRALLIEAAFGLGDSFVSGRAAADRFELRGGQILSRQIAAKARATVASPEGGTREVGVPPDQERAPALSDDRLLQLEALGRRIEGHFGAPQDIEWCLAGGALHLVQSRPITTLYPIPEGGAGGNRIYLSVGHQQMMTEAMRPLGRDLFQLTAGRPMLEAGSRLFVDPTDDLASPARRAPMLAMFARFDPLFHDAVSALLDREGFIPVAPAEPAPPPDAGRAALLAPAPAEPTLIGELVAEHKRALEDLQREIAAKTGPELVDCIVSDVQALKRLMVDPRSLAAIMSGLNAAAWLNERMFAWLDLRNAADTLTRSAPGNVTSEMGLALLDLADRLRPHPELMEYLAGARDEALLEGLTRIEGGAEFQRALLDFLDRYGARCTGEIDLSQPRWHERPTTLVPVLLSNARSFGPGEGIRRFEQGKHEALAMEEALLARLRALPDGEGKAEETRQTIRRLRTFIGYREYPKYSMIRRYWVYKQALLREADRLVAAGVFSGRDDLWFFTLGELRGILETRRMDAQLLDARRRRFARDQRLRPPRVMSSDGEIVSGSYRRADLPAGAIPGLAASAGVVEGRARVLRALSGAVLAPGDILVTTFTDPGWTAVFPTISGLVTEVGGLMTHGAVIAREYGLPAVVGVEGATRRIREGQRLRLHGTAGFVEILDPPDQSV